MKLIINSCVCLSHSKFAMNVSCVALVFTQSIYAAIGTWTGPSNGTWSTLSTNWSGVTGSPWSSTSGGLNQALFATDNLNVNVNTAVFTNGIDFNKSGVLGGGSITIVGASTINVVDGVTGTVRSILTGTGSLTKSSAGNLVLLGANTYSGNTNVTGGLLSLTEGQIYTNHRFASAQISVNGGGIIEVGGWGESASAGLGQVSFNNENIIINNGTIRYKAGKEGGRTHRGFTIAAGGATLDAAGGPYEFNLITAGVPAITSNAGGTLTLTGSSNGVLGHSLGGSGGLLKSGVGKWRLSGNNTYTGNTTVTGGILSLEKGCIYHNNLWASRQITINNGGIVEVGGWGDNAAAGFGQVEFSSRNILVDGGSIRFLGGSESGITDRGFTIGVNGATLSADGNLYPFVLSHGRGYGITSDKYGALTLSGAYRGVLSHNLGGNGGLVKSGSGIWTLSGVNTYSGNTEINGGRLILSDGKIYHNAAFTRKQINIRNGASVEIGGWGDAALAGFGEVALDSSNLMIDGGIITYVGGREGGNLDRGFSIGANGATLEADGRTDVFTLNSGRGYGITSNHGGTLTLSGEFNGILNHSVGGTGAFQKWGNGMWSLLANSNYSGKTTVSAGTLSLARSRIYHNAGFANRLIEIDGDAIVEIGGWGDGALAGFGQVGFNNTNIVVNGGTIKYTGGYESGSVDRGFTIGAFGATLDAAGGTNLFRLDLGRGFGINSSHGGNLTLTGSSNGIFSNRLGGTGGLVKSGTGTWTLQGGNTYAGDTTVSGGTLKVNGASIPDTSKLIINGGSLDLVGTETVNTLFFGSVQMPRGIYIANGNQLTGSGNLIVLSDSAKPYVAWSNKMFTVDDVPPTAGDRDNDGMSNWAEFAFGLNPTSGSSYNPIVVPLNASTGRFTYQRLAASDLKYKIFTSSTLAPGSWIHDATATQVASAIDINGNQRVDVTLTKAPFQVIPKMFVRVVAESDWQMREGELAPLGDNSSGFSYSGTSYVSYADPINFDYGFSAKFKKPEVNKSVFIGMTKSKPIDGDELNVNMATSDGAYPGIGIILTPKNNGVNVQMQVDGVALPLTNIPFIDNFDWNAEHLFSYEVVSGKTNLQFCIDGVPCDPELDNGPYRRPLMSAGYKGYLTLGGVNGDLVVDKIRFITAVLEVKNNGAVGNGVIDDGSAISKTIFDAENYITSYPHGNVIVKLENDTVYKMDNMGTYARNPFCALNIQKTKNITILGKNTTIRVAPRRKYMDISDSSNIKVHGINFDITSKPSVRMLVIALNQEAGTMDVASPINLDFDGNAFIVPGDSLFGIPDEIGRGHTYFTRYERLQQTNTFRLYLKDGGRNYRFTNNFLRVGQYYHIPVPNVAFVTESQNAISLWRNGEIQMKDCNVWSVPTFCFDIKFNTGNISFDNVNIRPERDGTVEYGSNMGWRDGFHCKENLGSFTFNRCEIKGINDDAINIAASYMTIWKVVSSSRFSMITDGYSGQYPKMKAGDEISIINLKTGEFIINTKIKKVYASFLATHDLEIEGAVPTEKLRSDGIKVLPYFGSAPGSKINGCSIEGTVRFRSPVTIQDTKLSLLQMWIQNDGEHECPIPKDITFKNCTIINPRPGSPPAISIHTYTMTGVTPQYKCKNIVFDNCNYNLPREQMFSIHEGSEVIFR